MTRLLSFGIIRWISRDIIFQVIVPLMVAILGAWLTYWFSKRGDGNKINRQLASLLPELSEHVHLASLELDGVLVPWLGRQMGRGSYTSGAQGPPIPIDNRGPMSHKNYDQFFADLTTSELGTRLDSHYDRVSSHNSFLKEHPSNCPPLEFPNFVKRLGLLLEGAFGLVEAIVAIKGITSVLSADQKATLEGMNANPTKQLFSIHAALWRTRVEELEAAERGERLDHPLPEILTGPTNEQRALWIRRVREG